MQIVISSAIDNSDYTRKTFTYLDDNQQVNSNIDTIISQV